MSLIHKLSIEQVSLYFDTEDKKYLTKNRFDKSIEQRFMLEFNELFDSKLNLSDEALRIIMSNRAYNLLPAIYYGLTQSLQAGNIREIKRARDNYKREYGSDFNNVSQLKGILSDIDRLKTKLKKYDKPERSDEKYDFEKIVISVEHVLNMNIDRKLKLYQFKRYYNKAVEHGRD